MASQLEKDIYRRSTLLLGTDTLARMAEARVIIFGVGGVGSWCAECLVRTGVTHLTIVDSDLVCVTNCNRQLMATSQTVGQVKVEAMKKHLLEINPEAEIIALNKVYDETTSESFHLEQFDFVIDAIDSLADKAHLILTATALSKANKKLTLLSSMGAARRVDPLKVRLAEFWQVQGDALARALRTKFKKAKTYPACKFQCVYSEEPLLDNLGAGQVEEEWSEKKPLTNGSLCAVTATFGNALASIVIRKLMQPK